MAEPLLDHVHRDAGLQQERRVPVPQAARPAVRQVEPANIAHHGRFDGLRYDRFAVATIEDVVADVPVAPQRVTAFGLPGLLRRQQTDARAIEREAPASRTARALADEEASEVKCYVAPAGRGQPREPQAGICSGPGQRVQPAIPYPVEEGRALIWHPDWPCARFITLRSADDEAVRSSAWGVELSCACEAGQRDLVCQHGAAVPRVEGLVDGVHSVPI